MSSAWLRLNIMLRKNMTAVRVCFSERERGAREKNNLGFFVSEMQLFLVRKIKERER